MKSERTLPLLLLLATWGLAALPCAGAELRGCVWTPDDKTAAGAIVAVWYVHDTAGTLTRRLAETKSDEIGAFRVDSPEQAAAVPAAADVPVRRRYLVATLPGCAAGITEVAPDRNDGYSLFLLKARTVTVRVLDGDGLRVPNAEVRFGPDALLGYGFWGCFSAAGRLGVDTLWRALSLARTDAAGTVKCDGLPEEALAVYTSHPAKGQGEWRVAAEQDMVTFRMPGKVAAVHAKAAPPQAPEQTADAVVRGPDGAPLAALIAGLHGDVSLLARADAEGRARLLGLTKGRAERLYVRTPDGRFAALATVTPAAAPVQITLRPACAARITLRDERGEAVGGRVIGLLRDEDGRGSTRLPLLSIAEEKAVEGTLVKGLPAGVTLVLAAQGVPGMRMAEAKGASCKIADVVGEQAFTIKMKDDPLAGPRRRRPLAGARPGRRPVFTARTDADLQKDLAALKDEIVATHRDPHDEDLTWHVLKHGFAVSDAARKELKRNDGFFDIANLKVTALAFAADKVWLGTSSGLFAWDRADRYWTRFAVNASLLDPPIAALVFDDNGRLRVTLAEPKQEKRTFVYDPETQRWNPVP